MTEKANRVVYIADELLQNRKASVRDEAGNPANRLGVYAVYGDDHTTSLGSDWQNHKMVKNGVCVSAEDALGQWLSATGDQAWIQDSAPDTFNANTTWTATYRITNTAYSGWSASWSSCP
jgi:hypothetical protein